MLALPASRLQRGRATLTPRNQAQETAFLRHLHYQWQPCRLEWQQHCRHVWQFGQQKSPRDLDAMCGARLAYGASGAMRCAVPADGMVLSAYARATLCPVPA
eukprot:3403920-Rhodomonas_salina.1